MDLDELRGVQASERSTDSLQALRDSFYREVAEYIDGLRAERARAAERADDPFGSEEVRHLTDEIETAQEVAEAIYDRRLGKVVKHASLAAAGMPTDEEGLTDEEADLFAAVVDEIESRRDAVLARFAGDGAMAVTDADREGASDPGDAPGDATATEAAAAVGDGSLAPGSSGGDRRGAGTGATGGSGTERSDPDPPVRKGTAGSGSGDDGGPDAEFDAGRAMGGDGAAESPPSETREGGRSGGTEDDGPTDAEEATPDGGRLAADRATVRITAEVGEIMGVDEHVYDLADGDVVTLPTANAEPLLERDAASRIE